MAKPSVTTVKEWDTVYKSELVAVYSGTSVFPQDYWKVVPTTGKTKYFYGELAWTNAQRLASDIDFRAWGFQTSTKKGDAEQTLGIFFYAESN